MTALPFRYLARRTVASSTVEIDVSQYAFSAPVTCPPAWSRSLRSSTATSRTAVVVKLRPGKTTRRRMRLGRLPSGAPPFASVGGMNGLTATAPAT
ncbi:MAG: hypothetical protein JO023_05395 [Chloroflexi bacterium]|nr:hypothetical protein [Chloroflexota bacterium]